MYLDKDGALQKKKRFIITCKCEDFEELFL